MDAKKKKHSQYSRNSHTLKPTHTERPNGWTARFIFAFCPTTIAVDRSFEVEILRFYLEFWVEKNANDQPIVLNQLKWVQTVRTKKSRSRQHQEEQKQKSHVPPPLQILGLEILTQMAIKQIKWDSKCVIASGSVSQNQWATHLGRKFDWIFNIIVSIGLFGNNVIVCFSTRIFWIFFFLL